MTSFAVEYKTSRIVEVGFGVSLGEQPHSADQDQGVEREQVDGGGDFFLFGPVPLVSFPLLMGGGPLSCLLPLETMLSKLEGYWPWISRGSGRREGGEVSPSPAGGKCVEGWKRLDEAETRLVKAEAMVVEIV